MFKHFRSFVLLLSLFQLGIAADIQNQWPQTAISNGPLRVSVYLPDPKHGFYRGTRFDWSGVIRSLVYHSHNYYGPWFTKTDPNVIDFIFKGGDIIAGPCSAITGPVEEFSSKEKGLGFDEAKPGGTFIKIGVGVLRRPDDRAYNPYRLYDIIDGGKWNIRTTADSVEFTQDLSDPASGYSYRYIKTIRLTSGKPEMILEHKLENIGRRVIETSVYDHNFLVLDNQPTGPDFIVTVPFMIRARQTQNPDLAQINGNRFTYQKQLTGTQTVSAEFFGFSNTAEDYKIRIENRKVGAGIEITADRPLSQENLWSIRSVLAVEPFIKILIEPGQTFTWKYHYSYYLLND